MRTWFFRLQNLETRFSIWFMEDIRGDDISWHVVRWLRDYAKMQNKNRGPNVWKLAGCFQLPPYQRLYTISILIFDKTVFCCSRWRNDCFSVWKKGDTQKKIVTQASVFENCDFTCVVHIFMLLCISLYCRQSLFGNSVRK